MVSSMRTSRRVGAGLACVALSLAACSTLVGGAGGDADGSARDASLADFATQVDADGAGARPDAARAGDPGGAEADGGPDSAGERPADALSPEGPDADPDADVGPCSPPRLGCPCGPDARCADALACRSLGGFDRCAPACAAGCPEGWTCASGAADASCAPRHLMHCAPCMEAADCQAIDGVCVTFGAAGSFCTSPCADDGDCPVGATCSSYLLGRGPEAHQVDVCLPTGLACECTAEARATSASTACTLLGPHGKCVGVRSCGPDGLSPCAATPDADELCDGLDDDCDGLTDEGLGGEPCEAASALGVCAGVMACVGGAMVCTAPAPIVEACNGADDDCDGQTDEGFPVGQPCQGPSESCSGALACTPDGSGVFCQLPWVFEACNGLDDDCDGLTDEDFALGAPCERGVGQCARLGVNVCEPGGPAVTCSAVPGAPVAEGCDGLDDDCDGLTDEGCDDDGDGYCDDAMAYVGSAACPLGPGDCDDGALSVSPVGNESCLTPADDDCDGDTNDVGAVACTPFLLDADRDGYGAEVALCLCQPVAPWDAIAGGDCQDESAAQSPALAELCATPFDDDCDGASGEGEALDCTVYLRDGDGDGWGVEEDASCMCAPAFPYTALAGGDCDDAAPAVHPEQPEACDGLDDDCDGTTDGHERPCDAGCGSGTETCVAGLWSACTAPAASCPAGPCCVGCGLAPAGTVCAAAPVATRLTCTGGCGGAIHQQDWWPTCTGGDAACDESQGEWQDVGPVGVCGAGELCVDAPTGASCAPCPFGCSGAECLGEPG